MESRGVGRSLLPFILILLVAVLARAAVFRGFAASDDADYAAAAYEITQGHFPPVGEGLPPHYPTRLGVTVPVALCFKLFGVHEWSLLLFPMAMSAASLGLAYALGRVFFSRRAGLIAMLLYAVMPIDCQFATWCLSDVPGAAWSAGGMLALVLGSRAEGRGRKAAAGLIAALCFGLSWITRTQVAQLAPFVAALAVLWAWRDRRNEWLAGTLALGVAGVVIGEGLFYLATRGDFFYVLHAMERLYAAHGSRQYFREGSPYGWEPGHHALGLVKRLFKTGPETIFLNPNFALVPLAALLAALHAMWWRQGRFALPAAWFLWSAFIFNFGSASLRRYEPLPCVDAYVVPVLLPAVALAGGWLAWALETPAGPERAAARERRFAAALLCAMIAISAAFGLYQRYRQGIGCGSTRPVAQDLCPKLQSDPAFVLYTDPATRRALEFFCGYNVKAKLWEGDFYPAGALLLVNPPELQRVSDQSGCGMPSYPPSWRVEKQWGEVKLYRMIIVTATSPGG